LPGDLPYFRQRTWGKPIIMGRRTWESLRGPLPGRTNIVVTRQPAYEAGGVRVVQSLSAAIQMAQDIALIEGAPEVMVMGGADIYAQALPLASRLYLTEVHAEIEGDAFFPDVDLADFTETFREDFAPSGDNPYAFSFVTYVRLDGTRSDDERDSR
jgi:dihydrofolate reductase